MDDQVTIFTPHYRMQGIITMILAIGGGWGVIIYKLLHGVHGIADGVVLLGGGVVACCGCLVLWHVEKRIRFREDDLLIERYYHRMIRLRYGDIRDIGRDAIITTQGVIFLGIIANADELIDRLCDKIHEGKIAPHYLEGKLRVKPWACLPRISWRPRARTRRHPSAHHHGIWINVRPDASGKTAKRWQRLQAYLDQGRMRRVERILTGISYHEWVRTVSADDILFYLSVKRQLWTCRMVLINAICRDPFTRKKHVTAVCRTFHELLLRFDAYQQTDVLCSIVGFFEAAGFTPALYELTWWRNYFLQTGNKPL
jgi:hypothetical protein